MRPQGSSLNLMKSIRKGTDVPMYAGAVCATNTNFDKGQINQFVNRWVDLPVASPGSFTYPTQYDTAVSLIK